MTWTAFDWFMLAFCVLFIAGIGIGTWLSIRNDERMRQKAREGGCICQMGTYVEWIRSDCPYHGGG